MERRDLGSKRRCYISLGQIQKSQLGSPRKATVRPAKTAHRSFPVTHSPSHSLIGSAPLPPSSRVAFGSHGHCWLKKSRISNPGLIGTSLPAWNRSLVSSLVSVTNEW